MSERCVWIVARRAALPLAIVVALTGCALIPTSGPVEQASQAPAGGGMPRFDIQPAAPVPGASPDQILAGFLAAVSSNSETRFTIARQYLTGAAAGEWNPAASVTIYDSTTGGPVTDDKSAVLTSPVVGQVDADGRYTAVSVPGFSHNFAMEQVDGQWRIGDPGPGILVSQTRFSQVFRAVPIYYFDHGLDRLVIENLYMNWVDATPTAAVAGLIKGPSPWLGPAVVTAVPPQTKLAVSSVPTPGGVAVISLTDPALGLDGSQRLRLATQLVWTLQGFAVSGVTIDVAGTHLKVTGEDADGVFRIVAAGDHQTIDAPASQNVYALLEDHSVAVLSTAAGGPAQPLPGPLGTADAWPDGPANQLAVGPDGATLAATSPTKLWLGSTTSGEPARVVAEGTDFTRPQVNGQGTWVIDRRAVPVLQLVGRAGDLQQVALGDLAGAHVAAFRVAPDRTRIVVALTIGGVSELGLLRIKSTAPLEVDGWRPLTVLTDHGPFVSVEDVGWLSATQLVALATTSKDGKASVFRMDVDAATVAAIGPLSGEAPVALAVQPRAEGVTAIAVTASGAGLHYEDATRWPPLATGLLAVALPD